MWELPGLAMKNFDEHLDILVLKNLWRAEELYRPVPSIRGQVNYWGKKLDQYNLIENEMQVEGFLQPIPIHSIERFILGLGRD